MSSAERATFHRRTSSMAPTKLSPIDTRVSSPAAGSAVVADVVSWARPLIYSFKFAPSEVAATCTKGDEVVKSASEATDVTAASAVESESLPSRHSIRYLPGLVMMAPSVPSALIHASRVTREASASTAALSTVRCDVPSKV